MVRSRPTIIFFAVALLAGCGDNAFEPSGGTEEFDWTGTVAAGPPPRTRRPMAPP